MKYKKIISYICMVVVCFTTVAYLQAAEQSKPQLQHLIGKK